MLVFRDKTGCDRQNFNKKERILYIHGNLTLTNKLFVRVYNMLVINAISTKELYLTTCRGNETLTHLMIL